MPIVTKQIREGPRFECRILAVAERNQDNRLNCPTIEFFQLAEAREPDDLLKLSVLLTHLAELKTIRDPAKLKPLGEAEMWEFRTKRGLRLLGFRDGGDDLFVCTNGTIKKKDDLDDADIETAKRWRSLYLSAKIKRTLSHEPEHIDQARRVRRR